MNETKEKLYERYEITEVEATIKNDELTNGGRL